MRVYSKKITPKSDAEIALEIKLERENMVKETIGTAVSKVSLVKEIKQGLGKEIKTKGGRVTIIKKTRYQRFIAWLKKNIIKF